MCVCVCVCVPLNRIYFLSFLKSFCHLIEKLSVSVLVKTEFKYLLWFLSYSCLKLRSEKNYVKKHQIFIYGSKF